jgi:hypothetical protein
MTMAVTEARFKETATVTATQWFRNGDHPDDGIGEERIDPISGETYKGIEGNVVRFYRHPNIPGSSECSKCGNAMDDHGWIDTLEDGHNVCPGDWIITGIQGKRWPCKPDVFASTYERVADQETTP